jgi:hypothetical protein
MLTCDRPIINFPEAKLFRQYLPSLIYFLLPLYQSGTNQLPESTDAVLSRLYLKNPWDYINGMGAKRCVLSLSFVWVFFNVGNLFAFGQTAKLSAKA